MRMKNYFISDKTEKPCFIVSLHANIRKTALDQKSPGHPEVGAEDEEKYTEKNVHEPKIVLPKGKDRQGQENEFFWKNYYILRAWIWMYKIMPL